MKKPFAKIFAVALAILSSTSFFNFKTNAATELDDEKLTAISTSCSIIKDNIKTIQHEDSRIRIHLGGYYTAILSNFITSLNLILVRNNTPNTNLTENQTNYVAARSKFASDYIKYQKDLEELLTIDCVNEPAKFYDKLTATRENRAKVATDVTNLNSLVDKQLKLVKNLKEGL